MYAVLSPEGFASILWKDGSRAMEAAELMKITSHELLQMEVVDKVIPERGFNNHELLAAVKEEIAAELDNLSQLPLEQLWKIAIRDSGNIKNRSQKASFSRFGFLFEIDVSYLTREIYFSLKK